MADEIKVLDVEIASDSLMVTFTDGKIALLRTSEIYLVALDPEPWELEPMPLKVF